LVSLQFAHWGESVHKLTRRWRQPQEAIASLTGLRVVVHSVAGTAIYIYLQPIQKVREGILRRKQIGLLKARFRIIFSPEIHLK